MSLKLVNRSSTLPSALPNAGEASFSAPVTFPTISPIFCKPSEAMPKIARPLPIEPTAPRMDLTGDMTAEAAALKGAVMTLATPPKALLTLPTAEPADEVIDLKVLETVLAAAPNPLLMPLAMSPILSFASIAPTWTVSHMSLAWLPIDLRPVAAVLTAVPMALNDEEPVDATACTALFMLFSAVDTDPSPLMSALVSSW